MKKGGCGRLIKQISDEMRKNANNNLRNQNITVTQMDALVELSSVPAKQMALKELEQRLHVAQSTAAGIVARLEEKGFVEGLADAADRRVKLVRITESGQECVFSAHQKMLKMEERLLSDLTEAEREIFYMLLKKICAGLK